MARLAVSAAIRKAVLIGLPALLAALIISMALVEAWVRLQWDDQRGRPGFYLSDPVLGQRLSPGYDGWFAGVPVRVNRLGFRDDRDYAVEKAPGVFRILVLGDSVTFGHGTSGDTTYPHLLEQRLRAWQPDVAWEVWNLGVPGYATSQELAYLRQVADEWRPDLVVVGFFQNDLTGNEPEGAPSVSRRARSAVQRVMQRHLYSYEFYKRAYLTLRWRLLTDETGRERLEHLVNEEAQLGRQDFAGERGSTALTPVEIVDEDEVARFRCESQLMPDLRRAETLRARLAQPDVGIRAWTDAVRGFHDLARESTYPIVFFINMAPEACPEADRFFDGGTLAFDDLLQEILGAGAPVVSSARAFLRYRPSEMPGASGHAVGNANQVKAGVLFDYLVAHVLERGEIPDGRAGDERRP
ncbi:MAG: GDSL-type esterase/lipase family protein [Vicinamibacterales bacterium]|nr:GDSL-type esterase/lipase family protein [Vicinamibacterales bacterium]